VHAYNAASSALKTLGDKSLALVAADRAARHGAAIDDPVLTASGAYRVANVFLPAGETADARSVALDADEPLPQLTRDLGQSHAYRGRRRTVCR
jgi:hypothetical protein